MSAQTTFINNLLNAAFRGATYTGGTIKMALFTGALPSAGGTEVTGGSYARQTLTFSAASAKKISATANAVFTNLLSSQTVVAFGIYDGVTLIDEQTLSAPFTPDISTNEIDISYYFQITG